MSWLVLALVLSVALFALVAGPCRWLYRRSVNMKNKLQMSVLFANITHEILTPLTILSSSIELMRAKTPQNAAEYDMMELNIRRITRLLQQILEANKSKSGELRLLVSNGDVMEYVRNTALCVKPLMLKHGQTFAVTCAPENMRGWIDPDKLDKIIYNLLSNAAKYAGDKGHIRLDARANANYDHIIIRVSDDGCGIPKERQKHLFERFYDGDYRQHRTFGTGLGLNLTRDLVCLHGGTIAFESEAGRGTTFTVTLPITKEAFDPSQIDEDNPIKMDIPQASIADCTRQLERETAGGPGGGADPGADEDAYKLLLVEDNAELLLLMRQLLSPQYRVFTAGNGAEAVKVVRAQDLDLIVSDVMMPVMDGYQLTRRIKGSPDYCHLPIILLTAKTQEEDRDRALLIGADDYVTKPFKMGDLRLRINNIIQNRQRIQADFSRQTVEEMRRRVAAAPAPDSDFLSRAIACVSRHVGDADYDRDAFATDMGVSQSSLYNKLRSLTGLSVSSFIRDIRMKEARHIIGKEPNLRVSELAYRVGFKDPKYFATIFKKEFGVQPKEFIRAAPAQPEENKPSDVNTC